MNGVKQWENEDKQKSYLLNCKGLMHMSSI